MRREPARWRSARLGREMPLLILGEGGLPVIAFPTSGGRFGEYEEQGVAAVLSDRIEARELTLYCVDSVNRESWYNPQLAGRERIRWQMAYEQYVVEEVVPLVRRSPEAAKPLAFGCSFGAYHAVNMALRHPEVFSGFVALSGVFDLKNFLDGYYDTDCYLNLPTHYLPNLTDARYLRQYMQSSYVLASGDDDPCLEENRRLDRVLTASGIPHRFHVWEGKRTHDWPTWRRMAREYL